MFGIVIDENGYKVEFVVINENKLPLAYKLKENESIIVSDWNKANAMLKPQWSGNNWAETATQDELNSAPSIIESVPKSEEILSKEVANIKIDNMEKDVVITNALQTIANLKIEVMNLKGGNA